MRANGSMSTKRSRHIAARSISLHLWSPGCRVHWAQSRERTYHIAERAICSGGYCRQRVVRRLSLMKRHALLARASNVDFSTSGAVYASACIAQMDSVNMHAITPAHQSKQRRQIHTQQFRLDGIHTQQTIFTHQYWTRWHHLGCTRN